MNTAQLDAPRVKETVPAPSSSASPASVAAAPPAASPPAHAGASHWWVYAILALAVAGFGYFIYHQLQASKTTGAATAKNRAVHDLPVVAERVRRGDLDQYLVGLGTVTPLNTVTVKSRVDGQITKIWFTEGQKVKAGDKLIDIDSSPYDAALAQAEGQLKRDAASLEGATWTVQADELAIKDHGIPEQQLHTDTATRDADAGAVALDNAAIKAAKVNVDYSHIKSPIDGTVGLRLVDEGNIVHASDTSGLVVITQLQPITVVFTVPEDNIDQVQKRIGSGMPVTVDAYDRDLTRKIATGKLLAVDNEVDPTTGTVKLKAQFDNQDNALFPSQFVNARMLVNTIKNAVLVPSAAIQHSPTSTFAYVVVPDPNADKAAAAAPGDAPTAAPSGAPATGPSTKPARESKIVTMRTVVTGANQPAIGSESEDTTVVLSGLQPGDVVVTDGVDKLIEGTKVIPTFADHSKRMSTTRESTTMPTTQATHRGRKPVAE